MEVTRLFQSDYYHNLLLNINIYNFYLLNNDLIHFNFNRLNNKL